MQHFLLKLYYFIGVISSMIFIGMIVSGVKWELEEKIKRLSLKDVIIALIITLFFILLGEFAFFQALQKFVFD